PIKQEKYHSPKYEFMLFDRFEEMLALIKEKDQEHGLSRMVAGFAWPWHTKRNPNAYDIAIEGISLRWNSTPLDWVNSPNAINEVGCIHTTQGYDLNYAAIIFGEEISYDPATQRIFIKKENYHDVNGKKTIRDPQVLHDYILNI